MNFWALLLEPTRLTLKRSGDVSLNLLRDNVSVASAGFVRIEHSIGSAM